MRFLPSSLLLLIALCGTLRAATELDAVLQSSYLVPGETTALTISISSPSSPVGRPVLPKVESLTFGSPQSGARVVRSANSRETVHFYHYPVRSFREGTHTIPPIEISVGGRSLRTKELQLVVRPLDTITWQEGSVAGSRLRYGSAVFVPARQPYVGETFPAEVKMYLPVDSVLSEKGYAELEHDGLTAWRFEPAGTIGSASLPVGNYSVVTFRSAASALRAGDVTLGPGSARMAFQVRPRSGIGFSFRNVSGSFAVPEIKLTALPLPQGAPSGFAGAVGQFRMEVSAETEDLEEGDPIAVRIKVGGSGNLDTLKIPALAANKTDWKLYEPSRLERQGERRSTSGEVSFSQIIRPLTPQTEVPPFELVFFDPAAKRYETIRSEAISFQASPSSNPGAAVAVVAKATNPTQDLKGILGLVDPLRSQPGPHPVTLYWQVLPAAALLLLLIALARKKLARRQTRPTTTKDALSALDGVASANSDSRAFLRAAGHYIETWIPSDHRDEEITEILHQRDRESFLPPGKESPISKKERSRVLTTIKNKVLASLSIVLLFGCLDCAHGSNAVDLYAQASQEWEAGNYRQALAHYEDAHPDQNYPADVAFNVGNCYFRLNEPGLAALNYRRALHANPHHREAEQNLAFLEQSLGAIQPRDTSFRETLTLWIRAHALTLVQAGMWTVAITITALFTFSRFLPRLLCWLLLPVGSLVLIVASAIYFTVDPRLTSFTSTDDLAVVVTRENASVRTEPIGGPASDPASLAPTVISAPPGTLCRPLAERGPWTYLELPDFTRGWLPSESLAPLVPHITSDEEPKNLL